MKGKSLDRGAISQCGTCHRFEGKPFPTPPPPPLTKRCLKKMVGQASLTQDELTTAVIEIEFIINSRLLSNISAGDTEEPLTPSHLLIGRRVLNLPDHLGYLCDPGYEDFDIDATQLTRTM